MSVHQVRHLLQVGDGVRVEFRCTAEKGAECRSGCKRCMDTSEERCICEDVTESGSYDITEDVPGEDKIGREPDIRDLGYCNIIAWLQEAPDEVYNGEEGAEVRQGWQPIVPEWTGDFYEWDYAPNDIKEQR